MSGNASASFAEAVQRHDTPATIPIDTPANTAAANTAVKTNTPIDVSKSVEMRIDQPLGLGFDPTLTVNTHTLSSRYITMFSSLDY